MSKEEKIEKVNGSETSHAVDRAFAEIKEALLLIPKDPKYFLRGVPGGMSRDAYHCMVSRCSSLYLMHITLIEQRIDLIERLLKENKDGSNSHADI